MALVVITLSIACSSLATGKDRTKSPAAAIGPTGGTLPNDSQSEATLGLFEAHREKELSFPGSCQEEEEEVSLKGKKATKRQSQAGTSRDGPRGRECSRSIQAPVPGPEALVLQQLPFNLVNYLRAYPVMQSSWNWVSVACKPKSSSQDKSLSPFVAQR